MAGRVLRRRNLTSPRAERSCQQTQLQPATAGAAWYSLCKQGEPPKSHRGVAASQTSAASHLCCTLVPKEVRVEGQLEKGAAGKIRKSKTYCKKGDKRGQKREESTREKQLMVVASLQEEMTCTRYISDLYVSCK